MLRPPTHTAPNYAGTHSASTLTTGDLSLDCHQSLFANALDIPIRGTTVSQSQASPSNIGLFGIVDGDSSCGGFTRLAPFDAVSCSSHECARKSMARRVLLIS